MSLAVYRRYRPKTISELLGQEAIADTLRNAARLDRIAHAYLFYGPRGCGKTSAARIVAKLANCEKRHADQEFKKTGEPCNECRPCTEIDEGRALDVIEIDAASNRGIDEIRALKEGIRLSPTSYRYKVFIIDEAHQLTKEAFNALLKTLEEPPKHAIFILATTEYDKVPATILSRVQRFGFKKVPARKIAEKLEKIAEDFEAKISPEAISLIASAAEGSFRDAESIFEQVAALEDNEITLAEVERILGKVGERRVSEFSEKLLGRDLEGSLNFLSEADEAGYNLTQLTKDTIHYLRRALVLSLNPKIEEVFREEFTEDSLAILKRQAASLNPEEVTGLIRGLIKTYGDMKYSPFAIVPLEVFVVENLRRQI